MRKTVLCQGGWTCPRWVWSWSSAAPKAFFHLQRRRSKSTVNIETPQRRRSSRKWLVGGFARVRRIVSKKASLECVSMRSDVITRIDPAPSYVGVPLPSISCSQLESYRLIVAPTGNDINYLHASVLLKVDWPHGTSVFVISFKPCLLVPNRFA